MLKNIGKFIFMIGLGYKYITIFKKTFFHPFITLKPAYKQLSLDRQSYSKKVLDFLNIEVNVIGNLPKKIKFYMRLIIVLYLILLSWRVFFHDKV